MKKVVTISISAFLGFTFWGAGMVKMYAGHQFIGWIGPPWLVEQLEKYDLGLYAQFIAISQIVIGYMLLTTRFKLLGSIMLVPMLLNILMVTISQNWTGTPYVISALLMMNGCLLWQFRDYFLPLINESFSQSPYRTETKRTNIGHLVWISGLCLNLLSISVSYVEIQLAFYLSGAGVILGIMAFCVDRYILEKVLNH
jgi:hypothetical protein